MRLAGVLIGACMLVTASESLANVPNQFSVQGVLRDNMGSLQSMMVNVTIKLFADQNGGSPLATPVLSTAVMAVNGLFTLAVSVDAALAGVLAAPPIWL